MKYIFASWNVNNRLLRPGHLQLIRETDADVLALQEVNPRFYEELRHSGHFGDSVFSLALQASDEARPRSRKLGCALFVKAPLRMATAYLLSELPFPERAVVADLETPDCCLTACSFHTPPGASWGRLKPQSHLVLAEWLRGKSTGLVLGLDANAPKTDHPDLTRNEWWWKEEPLLLGVERLHGLEDALRVYLASHPAELREIERVRPSGPLAVSHIRGNRRKRTECRYDFIFVTPDIKVHAVEYLYDASVRAGSDHAIVAAKLEVPDESEAE